MHTYAHFAVFNKLKDSLNNNIISSFACVNNDAVGYYHEVINGSYY